MIYVGLDVHKGYSSMGAFNPATGEIQDLGKVSNDRAALAAALTQVPSPKTVALEAGRSSYYMASLLDEMAEQVWIIDPGEVRRLQNKIAKTDRRDASAIVWWAAKGVLKPQWRPDAALLDLRELARGKTVMTRLSTQLRTMIRALLARNGYECPYRDLLSAKGQRWLEECKLSGHAGVMLASLKELLLVTREKELALEKAVEQAAAVYPTAQRLRTIPGIGAFLSLALAVEIGDVKRFPDPTNLRGYSGLTPSVHQSGDKDARGPLTKRGNSWLRYATGLAAQRISQMRNPDPRLKRIFLSVAFRHGRNPGKVAAARRLLDLIYYILKKEEDYRAPSMSTAQHS